MSKFIKYTTFLVLLAFHLSAQQKTEFSRRPQPDPSINNLKVGDHVPDLVISKIIRNNKSSAKLSDFKNQLIILDFWDTFCVNCIEALPKLDSLQKQFGNNVKILPVTYQSEAVMTTFFKNNKSVKNIKLPCVVEDKILGSYFHYKFISHEVWIYKGIVRAITFPDYVTAKNIKAILDGKVVDWPVKNDSDDFNPKKLIFVQSEADQYNTKSNFLKYSGITGQRAGIDYNKGIVYDTLANGYRASFFNYRIPMAFSMITNRIKPRNFIPHPDRLILEVKDRSKYIYDPKEGSLTDWEREHQFCYELVSAKSMTEKERLEYVYSDLNHLLGVNARWEKKRVKCLVLIRTKEITNLDSLNRTRKGTKITMDFIPVYFLDQTEKYPPAIDETGFKGNVIIQPIETVEDLKKQLQIYGCDIIEAEREIDVMVITENDYKK